jgi:hypothetical protein
MLHPRGRLGVHHGDHPRPPFLRERSHQCLVRDAFTPIGRHSHDARPVPPRDLRDTPAEEAALGHDHRVAGLHEVHDPRLHPGGARAVERQHQAVRHPVHPPQQVHDVEEDLVHRRVEVAEHRLRHGFEHRGVHVRGAGAAEQPLGGSKLGESVVHPTRVAQPHRDCKLRVLRNT